MGTRNAINVNALIAAARKNAGNDGLPPVHLWHPEQCADMDIEILRDGRWLHDGQPITRQSLVKLFSTILRKDDDGGIYLVTPVEKVRVRVACAPFLATRLDVQGQGEKQVLFFTTTVDDVIRCGAERPLRVKTDPKTLEPTPFVMVRNGLEALISRSVFYTLVNLAMEQETDAGTQLGVWSDGVFFALGPPGIHDE
jgi:uncharacterized protein